MSRERNKSKVNLDKWSARDKLNSDDSELDDSDESTDRLPKPLLKQKSLNDLTKSSSDEEELRK